MSDAATFIEVRLGGDGEVKRIELHPVGLPAAAASHPITVTYTPTLSPEMAALVWEQAQQLARPTLEPKGIGYRYESPPPIRPLYSFTDIARAQREVEMANAVIEAYITRVAAQPPSLGPTSR